MMNISVSLKVMNRFQGYGYTEYCMATVRMVLVQRKEGVRH